MTEGERVLPELLKSLFKLTLGLLGEEDKIEALCDVICGVKAMILDIN